MANPTLIHRLVDLIRRLRPGAGRLLTGPSEAEVDRGIADATSRSEGEAERARDAAAEAIRRVRGGGPGDPDVGPMGPEDQAP